MNEEVVLQFYPSACSDIPCHRLPFSVHKSLCNLLDGENEDWKRLAETIDPSLNFEEIKNKARISGNALIPHKRPNDDSEGSCTTVLLEELWSKQEMTVGDLSSLLQAKGNLVPVKKVLERFLKRKAKEEIDKTDDPREIARVRPAYLIRRPQHKVLERKEFIKLIDESFHKQGKGTHKRYQTPTVVIQADPGYGKSQVARQYGEWYYKDRALKGFPPFVYTLHAGNLAELYQSYLELTKVFDVDDPQSTVNVSGDLHDKLCALVAKVAPKLSSLESPGWLIIVDNLMNWKEDEKNKDKNILNYIPYYGNERSTTWGQGRVLITTQYKEEFKNSIPTKKLELNVKEAVSLVQLVVDEKGGKESQEEREELENIVQKLSCIPLALVSAAVYKKAMTDSSMKYSWKKYSTDIEKSTGSLKIGISTRKSEDNNYIAAVKLALEKVAENDSLIRGCFIVLTKCSFKQIPLEMLTRFIRETPFIKTLLEREDSDEFVLEKLRKCQLITIPLAKHDPILLDLHQVTHKTLCDEVVPEIIPLRLPKPALDILFPMMTTMVEYYRDLQKSKKILHLRYLESHLFTLGESANKSFDDIQGTDPDVQYDKDWKNLPEILFMFIENSQMSPNPVEKVKEAMDHCMSSARQLRVKGIVTTLRFAHYQSGQCGFKAAICEEEDAREIGYEALELMKKSEKEKLSLQGKQECSEADREIAEEISYALQSLSWHFGPEVDKGIKTIKENLSYVEKGFGKNSTKYALSLFQLAELVKKKDRAEARRLLDESIAILEQSPEISQTLATAYSYYARFLLKSYSSGDISLATKSLEHAIYILKVLNCSDTMGSISLHSSLARAHMMSFRPQLAINTVEPCLSTVTNHYYHRKDVEWRLRMALSVSYLMKGHLSESLENFKKVADLQENHDFYVSRADRKFIGVTIAILNPLCMASQVTSAAVRGCLRCLRWRPWATNEIGN